ncbi:MAG: hypothetical protein AABY40_01430 [Nanoarchaeota archaeon]
MKYQKIFWLEDTPDILGDVLRICAEHGVDKDSLFSRITFAPDYESGAEIVKAQEFDLYLLDADFPETTDEGWKKRYWEFMQNISLKTEHGDFLQYFEDKNESRYGPGYIGPSNNNFSRFFDQFLRDQNKTAVYSISSIAPTVAFHYGLPFYSKALDKEDIEKVVARNIGDERFLSRFIPAHIVPKIQDLEQWEYGSRFEFVERYLL